MDQVVNEPTISGIFSEPQSKEVKGDANQVDSLPPPEVKEVPKENLKDKLRQKMKTQKMQRNSTVAQRTLLKQANIPENMMDNAMNALRQKNANPYTNALQTMMSQLASMPKEKKMKAPNVELPKDKMKTPNVDFEKDDL